MIYYAVCKKSTNEIVEVHVNLDFNLSDNSLTVRGKEHDSPLAVGGVLRADGYYSPPVDLELDVVITGNGYYRTDSYGDKIYMIECGQYVTLNFRKIRSDSGEHIGAGSDEYILKTNCGFVGQDKSIIKLEEGSATLGLHPGKKYGYIEIELLPLNKNSPKQKYLPKLVVY